MNELKNVPKQFDYFYENLQYEILTDTGFQDFDGLLEAKSDSIIKIILEDDNYITCTLDHKIYINSEDYVLAKNLKINDEIYLNNYDTNIIKNIIYLNKSNTPVFDLLDVKNGNRFYNTTNKKPYILCGQSLYLDEFAFVENAEEFFASTMPVITSGETSQLIITSCVTDDTYVYTTNGIKQVKDFIDYTKGDNKELGYKTQRYNVDGYNDINYGSVMVNNGYTDTIKIKTDYTELECSMNHKLLVDIIDDTPRWKESKDLTINDEIYIKVCSNLWGNNDYIFLKDIEHFTWDSEIELQKYKTAFLIGQYLVSKNKVLNSIYLMLSDNEYSIEYFKDFNFNYHFDKETVFIKTHNKHIMELFNNLDLSIDNIIPKELLSCSRNVLLMIIKGIFSIIGNNNKTGYYFKYYKKELLNQIRIILLNVGICSILKYNKDSYYLIIPEEKTKLFNDNILSCCSFYFSELDYIKPYYKKIKILDITHSKNKVYDFSLDAVNNDAWCHSVVYNGIIGHQTPNGLNLFHKMYTEAKEGINGMKDLKYIWSDNPLRDDKWKEDNLGILGENRFRIEMESVSYDTIINIDGENVQIGELYEIMKNNNINN